MPYKRKQSAKDRELRLSEGRCPIHGGGLGQIDLDWIKLPSGHWEAHRSTAQCNRKDCNIKVYYNDKNDTWEIFEEFKNIMKGE